MNGLSGRWGGKQFVFACLVILALAGCDAIPTLGPHVNEVVDEGRAAKQYGFTLVNIDSDVVRAITAEPHGMLRQFFPNDHSIVPLIGRGDVLSITIYESGAGELFAPPSTQQLPYGTSVVALPAMTVGPHGTVFIPFGGEIKAAGLTPVELENAIRHRLTGKAVQPQVLVTVTTDHTNIVTVTGAARNPGRFRLTSASETLVQIVAEAGGSTGAATDTLLQLTRNGRQFGIRLSDLLSFPQQDIHAWPGDYINLVADPRDFVIYGAVYNSGAYSLLGERTTLTQAISRAGGMIDSAADSRGVFVFRYEYPQILHNIPPAQVISAPAPSLSSHMQMVPVVYRVDMKTAAGIFNADAFLLRDKDLIFVPTAPTVDWQKYLDLFRLTTSPVVSGTTSAVEINRGF